MCKIYVSIPYTHSIPNCMIHCIIQHTVQPYSIILSYCTVALLYGYGCTYFSIDGIFMISCWCHTAVQQAYKKKTICTTAHITQYFFHTTLFLFVFCTCVHQVRDNVSVLDGPSQSRSQCHNNVTSCVTYRTSQH